MTTTTLQKYDAFVVTLSQMFSGHKIMVGIECSLIQAGVTLLQMLSGYYMYISKILVARTSGKLPLWLSYAIN